MSLVKSLTKVKTIKPIWDFQKGGYFVEKIYGQSAIEFAYQTGLGKFLTKKILTRPAISRWYGSLQNSKKSIRKIPEFIEKYEIAMDEFERKEYANFNEFFIRRFRPGKRPYPKAIEILGSPCEGRLTAYDSSSEKLNLTLKGASLNLKQLLTPNSKDPAQQKLFDSIYPKLIGGPVGVFRLCPVDYHRYHYPDAGKKLGSYSIAGPLYSVHPIALESFGTILHTNQRRVEFVETKNFGTLVFVEIGAIFVGTIHQSHKPATFERGDEKGYFLFGGSCVVMLGEKGSFKWDSVLTQKTSEGYESYVKLGSSIAKSLK